MKVLWLCNIIPSIVAKTEEMKSNVSGGWVNGALEAVSNCDDIQLAVCFPQSKVKGLLSGNVGSIKYYGFPCSLRNAHRYDATLEKWMRIIIADFKPDVTHIWGTEFPQTLAMMKVHPDRNRVCISIQGLCSKIAVHNQAFLPGKVIHGCTLRDILRLDNIFFQTRKFAMRGETEAQALAMCKHIIGRTRWDYACTKQLAPDAVYHKCNETLRNEFYKKAGTWVLDRCEKHSIFVSQAGNSLKGFHLVIEAMARIVKQYPDVMLYTTGIDPATRPLYRRSAYQKYLRRLIEKYALNDHVKFLGILPEKEMCAQYLRANVFVSASSIENSPNSVAEAMMLGMPIVASYVGGTMDLLGDKIDGYLYQADAPYMLAHYVCEAFGDSEKAKRLGHAAYEHAMITHDRANNLNALMSIYELVCDQSGRRDGE